jgi:hypothetical protein
MFWMRPHRGAGQAYQVRHDECGFLQDNQNVIAQSFFFD